MASVERGKIKGFSKEGSDVLGFRILQKEVLEKEGGRMKERSITFLLALHHDCINLDHQTLERNKT